MHIRAFVGAALLCLASLAFAPVAMADPAPNICVLDLSQPVTVDQALQTSTAACIIVDAVDVAAPVPIIGGDDDEAAGPCSMKALRSTTVGSYRLHVDPGRCSA